MRVKGGLGPPGCLHPLLKVIYLLRIFSENWIIPGLERFNTFQNGSKRFKTVQWCPKPFARWETQRRRWAGLYRFLEIEVKTAFQWIERLKESGCGTGRLHWVHSDSFCISVVKFDQSGDLGWFGDVRWKLSHLEVLVQIFSPTAQWHCTQAWIVAQNTH